jgi:hypothetical protein
MGMQIGFNRVTLKRGWFRMYSKIQFLNKYWMLVNKQYNDAARAKYSYQGKFDADLSFFDEVEYNKKKDEAIRRLGEEKEKEEKLGSREQRYREILKHAVVQQIASGWSKAKIIKDWRIPQTTLKKLLDEASDIQESSSSIL